MRILLKTTNDLKAVLQRTALELAGSLMQTSRRRSGDLLDALADAALNADIERLQVQTSATFSQSSKKLDRFIGFQMVKLFGIYGEINVLMKWISGDWRSNGRTR